MRVNDNKNTSKITAAALLLLLGAAAQAQPAATLQRNEHQVSATSTAPGMNGAEASLYVREVSAATPTEAVPVLFVHGAGTPAEVAFDVPVAGYSWMAYLAERGFATYATDMTGYGRSTRPSQMADRCNLSEEQQKQEFGDACAATFASALTTMASDWNDIDAVVDYLRAKHGVDKVNLVGWSQGGPRTAGYASVHPDKVAGIVILAPAYNRQAAATAADAPIAGVAITKQSKTDFMNQWNGQTGCVDQYDPAVAAAVWSEMLASDPVGAKWGTGVRRAPRVPTFGWTSKELAATQTPIMMVAGLTDGQVNPERVREMYADLGARNKVLIELECASHNAMWERGAETLFDASYQWLHDNHYEGVTTGTFTLESGLTKK
ncbi:MAG: alpha/beta fold hydrolase [Pseudomonadota bacterium]